MGGCIFKIPPLGIDKRGGVETTENEYERLKGPRKMYSTNVLPVMTTKRCRDEDVHRHILTGIFEGEDEKRETRKN